MIHFPFQLLLTFNFYDYVYLRIANIIRNPVFHSWLSRSEDQIMVSSKFFRKRSELGVKSLNFVDPDELVTQDHQHHQPHFRPVARPNSRSRFVNYQNLLESGNPQV